MNRRSSRAGRITRRIIGRLGGVPLPPVPLDPPDFSPPDLPEPPDVDPPDIDPPSPQLLVAHQRFEMGDYAAAAAAYERLALNTRRTRQSARLLVEAGRARLMAGQVPQAMDLFRRGLGLLAEGGRVLELRRLSARVIQGLRERGYARQAEELSAWLEGRPAPNPVDDAAQPHSQKTRASQRLPLRCPACGGPVDPREVEWVDEGTAECAFCGGMLRAKAE